MKISDMILNREKEVERKYREKALKESERLNKLHTCYCPHWRGGTTYLGETFQCSDCGGRVSI